jgi:hypothetical protein
LFIPGKPFWPGFIFAGGRMKAAPLGLALLSNIRLGWKGLPKTNTLTSLVIKKKSFFKTLTTSVNVTKLFFLCHKCSSKKAYLFNQGIPIEREGSILFTSLC